MTQTDSVLVVVSQGEIDRTHAAMKDAIRRAENAEAQLAEARALLRDAVAQTLAANALGVELSKALAEIEAKDKRIAELEQLAALSPIKVGDISITMGLTENGEARMIFDGADDATLAIVAGKFAAAMQAVMDDAK